MKYKKLGNTDWEVSVICLGTMTYGEQNTQDEGFEQMDYALDHGVNFIDTAEMYSVPGRKETTGSTEVIIGNWIEKRKNRGRLDFKKRWDKIKSDFIRIYKNRKEIPGTSVQKLVTGRDEWIAEAYLETDYNPIKQELFENKIKDSSAGREIIF